MFLQNLNLRSVESKKIFLENIRNIKSDRSIIKLNKKNKHLYYDVQTSASAKVSKNEMLKTLISENANHI